MGCTGHLVGPRRHRVPNNDKSRKFEIDTPSHPGPDLPLMSCFAFQLNLDGPVHRSLNNVCITCKMFLGFCWQESAKFCLISVVFLVVFFPVQFFLSKFSIASSTAQVMFNPCSLPRTRIHLRWLLYIRNFNTLSSLSQSGQVAPKSRLQSRRTHK